MENHVFVACWCTQGEVDAELDSSCDGDLLQAAMPSFSAVSPTMSLGWVEKLKAAVMADLEEAFEEALPETAWETTGWIVPERGRQHQVFHCYDKADTTFGADLDSREPLATIVVQMADLDDC